MPCVPCTSDWYDAEAPDCASRRNAPRYDADFQVWLTLPASKGGSRLSGYATDLSAGGIGVHVGTQIEVGHLVTVEVIPPRCQRLLQLRAIVRRRAGYQYGLEFLQPTSLQKELITLSCTGLALS